MTKPDWFFWNDREALHMSSKPSSIDALAEHETKLFYQRRSEQFLDAAIDLMCVDFAPDVVVQKLRDLADHIEEHQ